MRILGIDPGFALMGYGVVDQKSGKYTPVEYGSLETTKNMAMQDRLKALYDGMTAIIERTRPEQAAIEELFFNRNITTAIFVAQARGVAILACANAGIPVAEYTPMQIKQSIAGSGKADKHQMQQMTKMLLGLSEVPKPDDTADALAAAICHGTRTLSSNRVVVRR